MLQRGTVLSGTYRIDGVLGQGGMAVVYAATHLRFTVRRAVKVLHAASALKGNIRARFVREGKVATSVGHTGAVEMIDDGVTEDGSPYLVMELLNGASLDVLGSRAIPLNAALHIAYQVLDVLRAAHENGIIHRDIKPANLFVLRNGQVKVLDFGISRLHDGAEPFDSQSTGSVMGTPFFMAPEQARAEVDEVDTRTDLFALGATLFKLISGEYLHPGHDSGQVMFQAATKHARSLATVTPDTPEAVVALVAKAVAYDRAARWTSAQAMQEAVLQVHEALYGPLEPGPLATLVLTREFRLKSRAWLTSRVRPLPWASSHADPSPLSTTLPAVAVVTRSVESYRPTPDSGSDRETSRDSEPSELAGWTGQVPAVPTSKARVNGADSRLRKTRLVLVGLLAVAATGGLFGFIRVQPQPRAVASKPSPILEIQPKLAAEAETKSIQDEAPPASAPVTSSKQSASIPPSKHSPASPRMKVPTTTTASATAPIPLAPPSATAPTPVNARPDGRLHISPTLSD